ncbi:hypothetical protein [Aurantiacibacter sediminis]|uniref:5-bromo-4-chloroindolyl phosphate hydrolase n=1 Tax=Aurantiacibacter sediminis TaxID=2793064 RepID=A0ABS0N178_9SPHN|nr:hypothetical protein [Aurantiacibacter sediminis]MBH5321728.1 hypothetical protein [Aurantiacibacter sediminis]
MDKDLIRFSERIMDDARRVLDDNRKGGRHRRDGKDLAIDLAGHAFKKSIGSHSVRMKAKHWIKKLIRAFGSVGVVIVGAVVVGLLMGGIDVIGVMIAGLLAMTLFTLFLAFPRMKTPQRVDLRRTQDAKRLVAQTEIWLESQRANLPAPAQNIVGTMGQQLDALGKQLVHVDPDHPAAGEVRKLVGEILPETIESYTRIPAHLRGEERAGSTPDRQLVSSLGKISKEIDSVTRQLAEGSLDALAIKDRYLDYRYGDADGNPLENGVPLNEGSGVPLPELDRSKAKR